MKAIKGGPGSLQETLRSYLNSKAIHDDGRIHLDISLDELKMLRVAVASPIPDVPGGKSMTLFRPHRFLLDEAMKEVVEVADLRALVDHMRGMYAFGPEESLPTLGNTIVEKYGTGIDERIGWDTHIVLVNGQAWGFTNGPLGE